VTLDNFDFDLADSIDVNQGLISPTCLRAALMLKDPKRAKRQSGHQYLFGLLGSA